MGSNSSWTSALLALSLTELEVLGSDIPQFGKRGGVEDDFTDTDTRNQMLEASRELHKYFHDCKDVVTRILEKQNFMSDKLGRDVVGLVAAEEAPELTAGPALLLGQVRAKLQVAYARDKAMKITNREQEVVRVWMDLHGCRESRKNKLNDGQAAEGGRRTEDTTRQPQLPNIKIGPLKTFWLLVIQIIKLDTRY